MKFKIVGTASVLAFSLFFLFSSSAFADKASVAIEAPKNAARGDEITIRLTVTHSANTERHHVEWVKLWVNNQELKKWEFPSSSLPEAVPFTREFKYKAAGDMEIKAEASCNVHGSKGPETFKISVK